MIKPPETLLTHLSPPESRFFLKHVVDVGMGQKDDVDLPRGKPEGPAVELVGLKPLVHPAIHEKLQAVYGEMVAGSGDFARRAEDGHFHEEAPQSFEW